MHETGIGGASKKNYYSKRKDMPNIYKAVGVRCTKKRSFVLILLPGAVSLVFAAAN